MSARTHAVSSKRAEMLQILGLCRARETDIAAHRLDLRIVAVARAEADIAADRADLQSATGVTIDVAADCLQMLVPADAGDPQVGTDERNLERAFLRHANLQVRRT